MKTIQIALGLVVMLVAGAAWASKEAYRLVMTKENALCENMLKIFNADMQRFGEIRYGDHEVFNRIQWQVIDIGRPTHGCEFLRQARFDFNNDGKGDLVIKWSACLRDNLSDSFYVFPADSDVLTRLKPEPGGWAPLFATPDKLERTGRVYSLGELSFKQTEGVAQAIGGVFVIQPFIWNKKAYVSMTDLHQDWIVINEYHGGDRFTDICYLHGKSRLNK